MSETQQSSNNMSHLSSLANRLQNNPAYMAWVLKIYGEQERLSLEKLTKRLNTTPAMFTRLALCKQPEVESITFANQVRQLSDYTGIDSIQLANLIRQVVSLETFKKLSNTTESFDNVQEQVTKPSWRGAFAAARDREVQDETITNAKSPEDNDQED
jgi:hypothetical protein